MVGLAQFDAGQLVHGCDVQGLRLFGGVQQCFERRDASLPAYSAYSAKDLVADGARRRIAEARKRRRSVDQGLHLADVELVEARADEALEHLESRLGAQLQPAIALRGAPRRFPPLFCPQTDSFLRERGGRWWPKSCLRTQSVAAILELPLGCSQGRSRSSDSLDGGYHELERRRPRK